MLALMFPAIDLVTIQIGPLAVRWYALAYISGTLLGWRYILWLNRGSQRVTARQHALALYPPIAFLMGRAQRAFLPAS